MSWLDTVGTASAAVAVLTVAALVLRHVVLHVVVPARARRLRQRNYLRVRVQRIRQRQEGEPHA